MTHQKGLFLKVTVHILVPSNIVFKVRPQTCRVTDSAAHMPEDRLEIK